MAIRILRNIVCVLGALSALAAGAGLPGVQTGKFSPEYIGGAEYYYDVRALTRARSPSCVPVARAWVTPRNKSHPRIGAGPGHGGRHALPLQAQ